MSDLFAVISPSVFLFACAVTMTGGFIKGAVGFAMPLVMVSGMGILIEPQIVVGFMVIPVVLTNLLQIVRAGFAASKDALVEHWRFVGVVCVMILVAAQFLTVIPANTMFIVLGVPVVALCAVQLAGWRPRLSPAWRRPFEWGAGFFAGTLGGLAGTWGPPTVLYLLALETPRARQMAVQGVIYGLGALMLLLGHLQSGVLNRETAPISAMLVVPAVLGMWLGFRLGERIDQDKFRRVTLLVLIVAGVNLIRRGVVG